MPAETGLAAPVAAPPLPRGALTYADAKATTTPKRKKWGDKEQRELLDRIREIAGGVVPRNAKVAVVSRGDPALLELDGPTAWHFPRDEGGDYAGYHPADSAHAIEELKKVRRAGADYLLFPATAFWWLDHYDEFKEYLESKCTRVASWKDTCVIFRLSGPPVDDAASRGDLASRFQEVLRSLLPSGSEVAVVNLGDEELIAPSDLRNREFGSSKDVVTELETLREGGVRYLAIPRTAFEWMAERSDLATRLKQTSRFITRQEHVCEVYELSMDGDDPSSHQRSEARAQRQDSAKPRTAFPRFLRRRI